MSRKLSVSKVSDSEWEAGGVLRDRACELLGGVSDRTLRRWDLELAGYLYTLESVERAVRARVAGGLQNPDDLALFHRETAAVPA